MARTKFILVALLVALLVPAQVGAFAEGEANVEETAFVTAFNLVFTSSFDFEPVPDMAIEVVTVEVDPIIIHYCGASNIIGTGSMRMHARVDGITIFGPEVQASASTIRLPACFTWVAPDVPPGIHIVDVVWRKVGGGFGVVQRRTLIVESGDDELDLN